jgi:drug/metabolite transporter (DMT)-like permease
MFVEAILFFFIVVVGTAGELCVTRALKIIGEMNRFTPRAILEFIGRSFRVGWMWVGFAMMALAYFALLGMLARANVSYVVPITSLSYVVGAVGGRWFLGESVSHRRWIGVLLVCGGVVLVYLGKG